MMFSPLKKRLEGVDRNPSVLRKDADSLNRSERVGDSQISWVKLATTHSVWNTADLVSRYVDSGRSVVTAQCVLQGKLERATFSFGIFIPLFSILVAEDC